MASLAGIYCFHEPPVSRRLIAALGNALVSHGPDGGGEFLSGSIGMAFRAFHTNRESCKDLQPLISSRGHVLCWDGRLDNRQELIDDLNGPHNAELTDVKIVSEIYLKRGINFLSRLIGDFALSLWDPQLKTLILARDPVGPRPLYYNLNVDRIIWSSELTPLLNLAGVNLEINDEFIAGHLTRGAELHLTPYKEIYAVSPGHVILVRRGQIRTERFWNLNTNLEIRYKTDTDYEEHFRHLFREAVRCRLRVNGPVWAQLSGGLDSSAIVCVADEILKNGEAEASKLETISYVYDESTSSDERTFITSVEEKIGRVGHHLTDARYPPLASFPIRSQISFPDFLDCFVDRHKAMCEAMRQAGARVLVTGHGGDEMLCGSGDPSPGFGDLLAQGCLLSLHQSLCDWSKASKKSYGALFWHDALMPLLPLRLQIAWGRKPRFRLPSWFDKRFVARMNLRERYLGPRDVFGFKFPSGRDQVAGLLSIMRFVAKASYRDRGSIELSHPYLHRPLIEFLQAIPFEQRVQPGNTKPLMRRAFADVLPAPVLNRKSKRGPDEALLRAIARQWPRLRPMFADARVCARGYVDREALLDALEKARHGCEPYSFALIQTISLEFWLRALENRSSLPKNIAAVEEPIDPMAAMKSANACAHANPTLEANSTKALVAVRTLNERRTPRWKAIIQFVK